MDSAIKYYYLLPLSVSESIFPLHIRFYRMYNKVLLSTPAVCFRETIFGYHDLKIQLYYSAARLTTYFGISYSDKVTPDKFEGIEVRFCFVFVPSFAPFVRVLLQQLQLHYSVT
jgi:hypothetical protein